MVIPEERILAANIIYQFSIISFALSLMSIPYTGTIVAHEKMSAFAYISIFDVIGKLAVALTISIAPIDKLIWFAGFIVFNSTIIQSIYIFIVNAILRNVLTISFLISLYSKICSVSPVGILSAL